jgi:hypothetical protein
MTAHPDFRQWLAFGKLITITYILSSSFLIQTSSTDEMMGAATYLAENLQDPRTATSHEPLDCPFSRAFGRELKFLFLEKPENAYRLRRFGAGMHGTRLINPAGALLTCTSSFHFIPEVDTD